MSYVSNAENASFKWMGCLFIWQYPTQYPCIFKVYCIIILAWVRVSMTSLLRFILTWQVVFCGNTTVGHVVYLTIKSVYWLYSNMSNIFFIIVNLVLVWSSKYHSSRTVSVCVTFFISSNWRLINWTVTRPSTDSISENEHEPLFLE